MLGSLILGSESVGESRTPSPVWAQGTLPRPEPKIAVYDESDSVVARVDFALAEYGVFL